VLRTLQLTHTAVLRVEVYIRSFNAFPETSAFTGPDALGSEYDFEQIAFSTTNGW